MSTKIGPVRVDDVRRRTLTRNGNPRFFIELADGRLVQTQDDASVNYEISESLIGKSVILLMSRNRVTGLEVQG